jgi:hypothetical protein
LIVEALTTLLDKIFFCLLQYKMGRLQPVHAASPLTSSSIGGKIVVSGIGQESSDEFALNLLNEQVGMRNTIQNLHSHVIRNVLFD